MSNLENCIEESMDVAMAPYTSTEAYQVPRQRISEAITLFRSSLNSEQTKEFIQLVNMINDADAEFASKAYVLGVIGGMECRSRVLDPCKTNE